MGFWRLGALGLFAAAAHAADVVELKSGAAVTGAVVRVGAEQVEMAGGADGAPGALPRADVARIRFGAPPVVAKPGGLILRDGTRLSGVLNRWGTNVEFRSTSLGPIEIGAAEVAVVYYDGQAIAAGRANRLDEVHAEDRSGAVYRGRVLWLDRRSLGINTAEGLKRVPVEQLAFVQSAKYAAGRRCVLRNGDVLNGALQCAGDAVDAAIAGQTSSVPLSALSEIGF